MKYVETNEKQREILNKYCSVEEVSESGIRDALFSRMIIRCRKPNTFATNLKETLIYSSLDPDSDNLYSWEYEIVTISLENVKVLRQELDLEKGPTLEKKF